MKKPIATPSRTKEILETHGMFAKKNYGQNFLIESGIVDKIARHAVLSDHCVVFEIGPGIGALTQYLCEYAKKVVSFEIDERLPDVLADTLQVLKKSLTFFITVRIIINGKFVKKIFGIIGNGTSSWMVMNNTNL